MKKYLPLILLIVLLGAMFWSPKSAFAQTKDYTVGESWSGMSCTGSVSTDSDSGQSIYDGLDTGDTVDLGVANDSTTQYVKVTISGPSIATTTITIAPGSESTDNTFTVPQYLDVDAVSTASSCASQSSNYSYLTFLAGSGSLTCSISDNQVWNIGGDFNDVVYQTTLYRGGTYVDEFDAKDNQMSADSQFSAQSTAQTYYLYNGSSSADALIGQVACPAKSTSTVSSTPSTTTTSTPTTTSATSGTTQATNPTTKSTNAHTSLPSMTVNTSSSTLNARNTSFKSKPTFWVVLIIGGLVALLLLVSAYRVFRKAGRHGWVAIIPVYNLWVLYELGGKPGWWALLACIPIVNIAALVVMLLASLEIARRFGKSKLFGVFGIFLFGFVGWPILAFDKAQYYAAPINSAPQTPTETLIPPATTA